MGDGCNQSSQWLFKENHTYGTSHKILRVFPRARLGKTPSSRWAMPFRDFASEHRALFVAAVRPASWWKARPETISLSFSLARTQTGRRRHSRHTASPCFPKGAVSPRVSPEVRGQPLLLSTSPFQSSQRKVACPWSNHEGGDTCPSSSGELSLSRLFSSLPFPSSFHQHFPSARATH